MNSLISGQLLISPQSRFTQCPPGRQRGGDVDLRVHAHDPQGDLLARVVRVEDADAQFDLGLMYAKGEGVPRNSVNAFKWRLLAKRDSDLIDAAYNWSINRMKESAPQMTAAQIARARREASQWIAAHQAAR